MQPILVIAALAVGAGLLSTGFLATNTIQIWTQDTGFGEADIETPIKHANIDFVVDKITVDLNSDVVGDEYYKNNIVACSFHTFETIEDGVEVVCKLQAWDYDSKVAGDSTLDASKQVVVCEGRAIFEGYVPSDIAYIGASQNEGDAEELLWEAYPGACSVDNIDGVQIVAQGERPYSAHCDDIDANLTIDANNNGMYEPWGADHDPKTLEDNDFCVGSTLNVIIIK